MLLEHERYCGLGKDALVTVCSWEHERYCGLGIDDLVTVCSGTPTLLWLGHGCSGNRMLLEHERYCGLGMDAVVTVCSWNTNVIMVWAWMLW